MPDGSDCAPMDPGRLASTLFVQCIRYYIITLPEGDGINNHLGKELVSDAEKAELEVRTGESVVFRPPHEIKRLRQDKGLMAFLCRSYEVFGLPVDIEFPKTLYQWEKSSNYWDAAYKSLNSAVDPASTVDRCISSNRNFPKRNLPSSLVAPTPSTTVNTCTCPRKDVAPEEKEKDVEVPKFSRRP